MFHVRVYDLCTIAIHPKEPMNLLNAWKLTILKTKIMTMLFYISIGFLKDTVLKGALYMGEHSHLHVCSYVTWSLKR